MRSILLPTPQYVKESHFCGMVLFTHRPTPSIRKKKMLPMDETAFIYFILTSNRFTGQLNLLNLIISLHHIEIQKYPHRGNTISDIPTVMLAIVSLQSWSTDKQLSLKNIKLFATEIVIHGEEITIPKQDNINKQSKIRLEPTTASITDSS